MIPAPCLLGTGSSTILRVFRLTASRGGQAASRSIGAGRQPSWQKLREAAQRSRSVTRAAAPFLSWVSLLWRERRVPAVCGARPGRSPAESRREHCRLPGAAPSIRSVSFQDLGCACSAASAPASLQSTWPGRARAALQKGLGSRQGLKRAG